MLALHRKSSSTTGETLMAEDLDGIVSDYTDDALFITPDGVKYGKDLRCRSGEPCLAIAVATSARETQAATSTGSTETQTHKRPPSYDVYAIPRQ